MSAPLRPVGLDAGAWIDVTRSLSPGHPNWPGDTPLVLRPTASQAAGESVNVMALETSTHAGTHLDAPYHYDETGERLGGVPLTALLGPCVVLDVRAERESGVSAGRAAASEPVTLPAALAALARLGRAVPPRALLHTGQRDVWEAFPAFRPLSVELVEGLAERGVRLLGTDAPSVDALTSTELPVHAACARAGVFIVEGLALSAVPEGTFELICLPLRLPTADASPVRALLRPLP